MLRENVKDAGEIIQNILTGPLDIPGAPENISLLSAAQSGNEEDLVRILHTFASYPEPLRVLITELELLSQDLYAM